MTGTRVTYLGIMRSIDRVMVAQYPAKPNNDADVFLHFMRSQDGSHLEQPGRRCTSEGSICSFHYITGEEGLVYCAITDKEYSGMITFQMLHELETKFLTGFRDRSRIAKEGALSRSNGKTLLDLIQKFDDPRKVDKMAAVQGKVEVVKMTMQANIQQLLENEDRLDGISQNADTLNTQAHVFENRATSLRRHMRCRAIKTWLLLGLAVGILLIIIIVPIVQHFKNN